MQFPYFRVFFLFVSWSFLITTVDQTNRGPLSAQFESDVHNGRYLNGMAGICSLSKQEFRPADSRMPPIRIPEYVVKRVPQVKYSDESLCMLHGLVSTDFVLRPNSFGVAALSADFRTLDQYEDHQIRVAIHTFLAVCSFFTTLALLAFTIYGFQ